MAAPKTYRVQVTHLTHLPGVRARPHVVTEQVIGARAAARRVAELVRQPGESGERRGFVFDGARMLMTCTNSIYNARRTRSARRTVARCEMVNPVFKRAIKQPAKRRR